MGIALFASIILVPVMLQNQFHYPVTTAGVTTAVQGLGTMIAMLVVSRLIKKIDARYVIACGIIMIASALWQMSHYSAGLTAPIFSGGTLCAEENAAKHVYQAAYAKLSRSRGACFRASERCTASLIP